MALVIPPLQTIQVQMEAVCASWKIPFLNISSISSPNEIPEKIEQIKPKILLSAIEDVNDEDIQDKLAMLDISYVAVDECQVCGLVGGVKTTRISFFIRILFTSLNLKIFK